MKNKGKIIGQVLAVTVWTVLTQVGGLIWLIALGTNRLLPPTPRSKIRFSGLFIGLCVLFNSCIIPVLAS